MADFDVIVAGGSIAGLLCAREIAAAGVSVVVLEDDPEIGTPEHCGGLVSIEGIRDLGVIPEASVIENSAISRASVTSPTKGFDIDAKNQKVIVLDRRAFDKQVALQAQRQGAEIRVRSAVRSLERQDNGYAVKTAECSLTCHFFVDARGVSTIIKNNREGVLQSAQYEVYAEWIKRDTIEIAFDSMKYPGFFAWVIPTGEGSGKVGVAGRAINAAEALQRYVDGKGKCSIIRKVFAPIWVRGPIAHFVADRTAVIGDAAGQSKPTTAGGIYTCGMGGIFAGCAIGNAMIGGNENALDRYSEEWLGRFKVEFERMLLARKLLERLDNKALDEIVSAVPPDKLEEASRTGDFDFHSSAVAKILSTKSAAKFAKALFGNELRRLFDFKQDINSV